MIMNKKEYIQPKAITISLAASALLAGSLDDGESVNGEYGGNDGGSGTAESRRNTWLWGDDAY